MDHAPQVTRPHAYIQHTFSPTWSPENPYPGYNPGAACMYELTTYLARTVRWHFYIEYMDLEFSHECAFDYVDVWRGLFRSNNAPPDAHLCGQEKPRYALSFGVRTCSVGGEVHFLKFTGGRVCRRTTSPESLNLSHQVPAGVRCERHVHRL